MLLNRCVSKRIFQLCKEYGYTPNHLAEMAGIPPSTLNDIILEKTAKPNVYVIVKICRVLNISLATFFDSKYFDLEKIDD